MWGGGWLEQEDIAFGTIGIHNKSCSNILEKKKIKTIFVRFSVAFQ